jgi:4-diphosphocytidyl-2-C-methyl-D-erythritol kinase
MRRYEAPAKLNLALLVFPPRPDGHHPVRSLVQTIEWCDLVTIDEGAEKDVLEVTGLEVSPEDNLVLEAVELVRALTPVPPLGLDLEKRIPPAAGLGGGSSDAAAVLRALADLIRLDEAVISETAGALGADVPLFLQGGTLEVTGIGEQVERLSNLEGIAFAVAVPEFGLSTAEVYRRWDELEGPEGEPLHEAALPPTLREGMPLRNDLLPAALDLQPLLGDFMADLGTIWGVPVSMTGSGSACFGYFGTVDEASDAAAAATHLSLETKGAALRHRGVAEIDSGGETATDR